MPLLPKPYPDEVIGSVLERACLQTGMSMKRLAKSLFGSSRSSFSFLMATDLLQLAPLMGIDSEELLLKHTMYPYTTAYMTPKEQTRLKSKILSRRDDECVGSITKSVSHGVPFRRVCTFCIEENFASFGEAYWQRGHLLPGVYFCHRHGSPLRDSAMPLKEHVELKSLKSVITPSDKNAAEIDISVSVETSDALLRWSMAALSSQVQMRDDWACLYRSLAVEKGYGIAGGDIAANRMSKDLTAFFGELHLEDAGCYYPARQRNPWPALLIRKCTPLNFATPKHVFFQTFFAVAQQSNGQFGYRKPGKTPIDFAKADASAVLAMTGVLNKIEEAGERTTVKELLQQIGIWQSFRHNRNHYPLTNELLQKFRASGQSQRQLGLRPYWRHRLRSRYRKMEAPGENN